jgi:hypothetical protein
MSVKYSTRGYQKGDEKQIVDCLEDAFKGWPKFDLKCTPLEHWEWKYQENYVNKKIIVVSEIDGKIIGVNHVAPQRVKVFQNVVLTGTGGDVAVLREYRRLGVRNANTALISKHISDAGFEFTCAVTSNPIVIDSFDGSTEFRRVPLDLTSFVIIRDIDLHLKNYPRDNEWIIKVGFRVLKSIVKTKNVIIRTKKNHENILVKDAREFDERIDRFWDKIKNHYNLINHCDRDYLNWRYCDLRAGPYKVKLAIEDDEVVGFIVLMLNRYRADYPVGNIMELLYLPERWDVVESLVSESVDYFDSYNVNMINFLFVRHPQLVTVLERNGFLDARVNNYIYYRLIGRADRMQKIMQSPVETLHFNSGNLI